jgi:hypothetical protein
MSDPPRLPGPPGQQPLSPSPTGGGARPPREFRPRLIGRERPGGMTESEALAELRRRRTGSSAPSPGPTAPAPAMQPWQPPAQGAFSPLTGAVGPPPGVDRAPAALEFQPGPLSSQDPFFDLVVQGQPQRVALSELIRGYMRQSDYTAKSQQNAEQLRVAQQAHQAFDAARVQMEQRLPQLIAGFGNEFDRPIDWEKLAREDPIGYAQKDARFKAYQIARAEQAHLAQIRANEETSRKMEMKRLGHEFLSQVVPGWSDPVTRQQLVGLHNQHLREVGYTPEELDQIELLDPRQIVILEESRRFRALVGAHPELLRETPRATPPARREMPSATGAGNGRGFDRQPGNGQASELQRQWDEMPDRTGANARELAVQLIGARRRASGTGSVAPLRPTRYRG